MPEEGMPNILPKDPTLLQIKFSLLSSQRHSQHLQSAPLHGSFPAPHKQPYPGSNLTWTQHILTFHLSPFIEKLLKQILNMCCFSISFLHTHLLKPCSLALTTYTSFISGVSTDPHSPNPGALFTSHLSRSLNRTDAVSHSLLSGKPWHRIPFPSLNSFTRLPFPFLLLSIK